MMIQKQTKCAVYIFTSACQLGFHIAMFRASVQLLLLHNIIRPIRSSARLAIYAVKV